MKMSDVFDLPFTADAEFQTIYDASGEPLPDFESVERGRAVVQAINSHDILVELCKELVDALQHAHGVIYHFTAMHNFTRPDYKIETDSLYLGQHLLDRVKELLREQGE